MTNKDTTNADLFMGLFARLSPEEAARLLMNAGSDGEPSKATPSSGEAGASTPSSKEETVSQAPGNVTVEAPVARGTHYYTTRQLAALGRLQADLMELHRLKCCKSSIVRAALEFALADIAAHGKDSKMVTTYLPQEKRRAST